MPSAPASSIPEHGPRNRHDGLPTAEASDPGRALTGCARAYGRMRDAGGTRAWGAADGH